VFRLLKHAKKERGFIMTINYLIAVGGVGSRIVESTVRLCENGYISTPTINCAMIDVDKGHGNTGDTLNLIERYNECRLNLKDVPTVFKTEIKFPSVLSEYRITPLQGIARTSVNAIAGNNANDYNLAKVILDEKEAGEEVDDGFYGNLTLGNVFYNYAMQSEVDSPFHKLLTKIAGNTRSDNNVVKVFICGSLFGGTGASGISFICQKLVDMVGTQNRSKLHIHAGLMLPYFKPEYTDAGAEAEKDENGEKQYKIRHEMFKKNAEAALQKYEKMENVFDAVVMVGDPQMPVRGKYSKEGRNQNNWPHILELSVAAEVGKFFSDEYVLADEKKPRATRWYANPFDLKEPNGEMKEYELERLQWDDFRIKGGPEADNRLRNSIERFLLFNYYYSMYIVPTLFNRKGEGLGTWDFTVDKNRVKNHLPKWAKTRFIELTFFGSLKGWYDNIAITKFTSLFEYFTKSAQWYYTLAYDYGSAEVRPCWETSETGGAACDGEPDGCVRQRNPLLPKLFQGRKADSKGLEKLLLNRACIHKADLIYWLENYSRDIDEYFGIEDPRIYTINDRVGDHTTETQNEMFVDILTETYEKIKDVLAGR